MSALPEAGRTRRLQYQFTAHLRDPKKNPAPADIEDRRMEIYRDLVFSNVENFLSSNFPVIHTLYGERDWLVLVRDFLREHQCHTPLFPEFGREFLRYVEARQEQNRGDPPFLLELAHYEWAELALTLDENNIDDVPHDPNGDPLTGVPVMSPLACVLAYRFPGSSDRAGLSSRRAARRTDRAAARARARRRSAFPRNQCTDRDADRTAAGERTKLTGEQCLDAHLLGAPAMPISLLRRGTGNTATVADPTRPCSELHARNAISPRICPHVPTFVTDPVTSRRLTHLPPTSSCSPLSCRIADIDVTTR